MAWAKLGTETAGSTVSTVTITAWTPVKFNFGLVHQIASTQANILHRVGQTTVDTGSNYAHRYNQNGTGDGTQTNRGNFWNYYQGADYDKFVVIYGINIASEEKLFITFGIQQNPAAGAASAPSRCEEVAKWANTSVQYDVIDMYDNGDTSTDAGSNISMIGTD